MTEKSIQTPSIGRVVIFTASYAEGIDNDGNRVIKIDCYPGIVTRVHDGGVVDIVTFGPSSIYHNNGVPYGVDQSGTWAWPQHVTETITVNF